jgi:formylmethanofuran dehydrogenase subunit C
MKKIVNYLVLAVISLSLPSCMFLGPSVKGNGNVKEEVREVGEFHGVRVTSGMNVHLIQGEKLKVVVSADANLHDLIETKVEDGILEIRALANIWHAEEKKVIVTAPNLSEISGTAGSNIFCDNQLSAGKISIKGSAGSNLRINIKGQNMDVSASSGSNIFIEGTADDLIIRTSSGANIKAGDLAAVKCEAKASSGGNLWVTASKELNADASSGGNIFYAGNPENLNSNNSSGGNVIKR